MGEAELDQIGYWSELKLDIVREYAKPYSIIINKKSNIRSHIYIDAFAGTGVHISRRTQEYVAGSPLNALNVEPPFKEFHFIDLDGGKADALRKLSSDLSNVHVYEGDCNKLLIENIFPRAKYSDYRRALCLLDPYGLHLNWKVVKTAGQMKSVEIFLNFPLMDMNRNVLWRNPDKVKPEQASRMDRFWGNHSWRDAAYTKTRDLFGEVEEKAANEAVAKAYKERLNKVAGFSDVPDPLPMRNSSGSIVYYLFFASHNKVGAKIVKDIFDKYRDRSVT
jgi:three-Cys-motif partner protein